MDCGLTDRVIVITGAAAGIGAAIARLAAAEGVGGLLLVDRDAVGGRAGGGGTGGGVLSGGTGGGCGACSDCGGGFGGVWADRRVGQCGGADVTRVVC